MKNRLNLPNHKDYKPDYLDRDMLLTNVRRMYFKLVEFENLQEKRDIAVEKKKQ